MAYYRRRYRKRPARRYRKRMVMRRRRTAPAIHAPKKFCLTTKLLDVIPSLTGGHADGWTKWNLKVAFSDFKGSGELATLYKQFAITGVKYEYRTLNINGSLIEDQPSLAMTFAEDKANIGLSNNANLQTQDNVRNLISTKNFKHYVAKPRPVLYQSVSVDLSGTVLSIPPARQIQWINTDSDNGMNLKHLAAQFQIQDYPAGVVNANIQGELWAKLYVIVKEQHVG